MEGNWRTEFAHLSRRDHFSRSQLVKHIMDSLQRHATLLSGQDVADELWTIASRFEQNIFNAASDKNDYVRTIFSKTMNLRLWTQDYPNGGFLPNNSESFMERNWRASLPQDRRSKVVHMIVYTLQRNTPPSGQDGVNELRKIANRLEEKIFYAACDQNDYARKIFLKMLNLELRTQNAPNGGSLPNNSTSTNQNPVRPLEPGIGQAQSRQQVVQLVQSGVLNNAIQGATGGQKHRAFLI